MKKLEVIREFILTNNIDENVPNKTIARMLCDRYPEMFDSLENARTSVRDLRGNKGKKSRDAQVNKPFFRANRTPEEVGREYNLKPVDIGIKDYEYKYKKPLILSDIHFPYHDLDALLIALDHGVKMGVDSIYLNGDVLDFYGISRFLKDPRAVSLAEERDMFWQFVDYIKENINIPITFKVGNHEERWNHYILRNSPELYGIKDFALNHFLRLEELGIDFVSGRQKCNMGKLIVIHGHEFGESVFSPVNPARGLFLRAKSSVLAGHNHQTSEHHENNLKGDSMACFSTGSLCQLTPEYRPFAYTKWNHGFAIVTIDNDGSFHVDNCRIIDGKVR